MALLIVVLLNTVMALRLFLDPLQLIAKAESSVVPHCKERKGNGPEFSFFTVLSVFSILAMSRLFSYLFRMVILNGRYSDQVFYEKKLNR